MVWFFPDRRERLRRRAARWLARLQGEPTAADVAAFRRWHDADPAHAEAFARVSAGFEMSGILRQSDRLRQHGVEPPRSRLSRRTGYALAASVAGLLVISGVVLMGRPQAPSSIDAKVLVFTTGIGEIRALALPDGTRVTLDTATSVRVEMRDDLRRVTLGRGRARFEVAAQDSRPFEVEAGSSLIAGTATFDVSLRDGSATVHAREGSVSIERADPRAGEVPVDLAPGQAVVVRPDGRRVVSETSAASGALWPTGRLEFDDTPLDRALAEANRYSRTQIRLADPGLSRLRLTGVFRAGDPEALAHGVAEALDLRLERANEGQYVLRARP